MKGSIKNMLLLGALLLAGCNRAVPTPSVPPVAAKPTNLYEVAFERVNTKTPEAQVKQVASGVSKQALNSVETGLSFKKLSVQTFTVESLNKRYVQASFQVTNNTGRTLTDLTFIPVDTDDTDGDTGNNQMDPTVGSTPFKSLYYFDRSDASVRAADLALSYPQIYRPALDQVENDATASPLVEELDLSTLTVTPPTGLSIAGVQDRGWRITGNLAPAATGVVTFAISYDMDADATKDPFGFSLVVAFADDPDQTGITRIHSIQGSTASGDAASSLNGQVVTIDGVVTADFQGSSELNGFFVQEQADHADSDPATSEGIFVYCNTTCADVSVGNRVQVTGTVTEFNTLTELTSVSSVVKLSSNTPLPAAVNVTLPVGSVNDWERYEGMRLSVSGVVTDNYLLGRGGSVKLADDRIPNFTQANLPTSSGYTSFLNDLARRTITIDDGAMGQNPEPVKFARGGLPLSASNTLRGGDTGSVTGVLSYSYDGWSGSTDSYRIHATTASFSGPARPAAPGNLGGSLTVASMNVLNYFNGNGSGAGFPTSRGAESLSEYNKQLTKIVEALIGLDADVIGLLEIENDYNTAIPAVQTLVNAINSHPNVSGTYTYVNPVAKVGTDEIAVGMIYRKDKVTPVGNLAVLDSTFNPLYVDTKNRPTWARSFQDISTGGIFTVVQAHLKSKGSGCGTGDDDTTTGQGNCNKTRNDAATVMMDWLNTQPTGINDSDVILMGDLNAYLKEDPIQTILKGADDAASTGDDFVSLFGETSYSYQFGSQWGSLDHAIASGSLSGQVSGAEKWHINSDEPTVLDYNENFKTSTQITNFYAADAYRSSDHDPLKVGLNLTADLAPAASFDVRASASNVDVTVGNSGTVYVGVLGSNYSLPVMLSATVSGGTGITVSYPNDPVLMGEASEAVQVDVPAGTPDGIYTVTLTGMGIPAGSDTATFTVTVTGNTPAPTTPWINELHYDNAGTDTGEFIEVIAPPGYDTTGLSVVLYNGNGGASYSTTTGLTFTLLASGYKVATVSYTNVFQNGAPDGMAICDGSTLIQFLSYEGTFAATNGCASGVTSTSIGVLEAGTEAAGLSLQLTGTGNEYSDFTWTGPITSTAGAVNTGQTLN